MAFCNIILNSGDTLLLNDGASAILLNDSSCAFEFGQDTTARPSGIGLPGDDRDARAHKLKIRAQIAKLVAEIEARGPLQPEIELPTPAELQQLALAELMAELDRVRLQHHLMLLAEDEEILWLMM